jgi:hypothetical protein
MTGLLGGSGYTMNQASYDLARLRLNGLITRVPCRYLYRLTGDGLRFAMSARHSNDCRRTTFTPAPGCRRAVASFAFTSR